MDKLIARLEKAIGADRELNKIIPAALGYVWNGTGPDPRWEHPSGATLRDDDYTGSLDAALTLVPEGWDWTVRGQDYEGVAFGYVRERRPINDPQRGAEGASMHATPALALCIAALKALRANQ